MSSATTSGQGHFSFVPLIILALLVVGVFVAFRVLKPRLREQRHRAWERAGLLPEQLDRHAPPHDPDDSSGRDGR